MMTGGIEWSRVEGSAGKGNEMQWNGVEGNEMVWSGVEGNKIE